MANWYKRKLYFDRWDLRELAHTPEAFLGDGVRLAFDNNSKMAVTISKTQYSDHSGLIHDALILRGTGRAPGDWMALEVDFNPEAKSLRFMMRYGPAERVYPRIYVTENGKSREVDLPDFPLASDYMWHHLSAEILEKYFTKDRSNITHVRLALLFPNRPWFAIGLSSIEELI